MSHDRLINTVGGVDAVLPCHRGAKETDSRESHWRGEVCLCQVWFPLDIIPPHLTDPKLGGGAMLDVGIHPIALATMIFGEKPESVHADGWLTSTGPGEFAAITLKCV